MEQSIGIIGNKSGMTRVFEEDGRSIPVTVVSVAPNRITQVKSIESDGYDAIQVASGHRKRSRVNKPIAGHYAKAGVEPGKVLKEFRVNSEQLAQFKAGDTLPLDQFSVGQTVDVTAWSKGKGFAGTVKRHNFQTQDMTHGNSKAHRKAGSIGQNQDPGKVFKGKKMAGQLGNVKTTVQTLEVIRVDMEQNVLLLKGALPGPVGNTVIIKPATKSGTQE